MSALVDVRLVQTRDGRVRVIVEGRRLFEAASASAALGFVTAQLAKVEPHRQLGALASALVGSTEPAQTGCVAEAAGRKETGSAAWAPIANETGNVEEAHVFEVGYPKRPTDSAIAKALVGGRSRADAGPQQKAHAFTGANAENPTETADANKTGCVDPAPISNETGRVAGKAVE